MRRPTGVLLPAIAVTALAVAGCGSASSPGLDDLVFDDTGVIPIVHEFSSGYSDPSRQVVRNQRDWAFAWSRAFAGRSPAPPRPRVDFSREMVIVAAQGARPSSGYDISVDRVAEVDGSIEVEVTSTTPAADCFLLAVITAPVAMVRVPASTSRVRFVERDRTLNCD